MRRSHSRTRARAGPESPCCFRTNWRHLLHLCTVCSRAVMEVFLLTLVRAVFNTVICLNNRLPHTSQKFGLATTYTKRKKAKAVCWSNS